MRATTARRVASWLIDGLLAWTVYLLLSAALGSEPLELDVFYLCGFVLTRKLVASLVITPGERFLSIGIHGNVPPSIVDCEDLFSLTLAMTLLVVGCRLLTQSVEGVPALPLLGMDHETSSRPLLGATLVLLAWALFKGHGSARIFGLPLSLLAMMSLMNADTAFHTWATDVLESGRRELGAGISASESEMFAEVWRNALIGLAGFAAFVLLTPVARRRS